MQEKRIEPINIVNDTSMKLRRVDEAFLDKDFLTETDIEEMARTIADSIQSKLGTLEEEDQKVEAVVDVLQASQVLESYVQKSMSKKVFIRSLSDGTTTLSWTDKDGIRQSEEITEQELEPFLQKIRIAVLNKLSGILPKNITAQMVKRYLGRVLELEGGRYYKKAGDRGGPERLARENNNQIQALKYLHNLPERSPFIYYGTESIDPQMGRTISRAIKLTNIKKILYQIEQLPFSKVLSYFNDAVEGHIFLLSSGLVLFDNNLENIGINKDTDKGILFDFDGLRQKKDETVYVVAPGYLPPERKDDFDSPATEASIVYELGVSLETIIRAYYGKGKVDKYMMEDLEKLSMSMRDTAPEQRPTLAQVKQKLQSIIGT